ncbi:MAG TPA: hypothetical protein VFG99_02095 [Chloroflexia bacterium]|nr:hypothetical protein [Chloroflexia bacterium]
MLDQTGNFRMEYEDVFRAIGYFIDQNSMKEVCIIELQEGILVRGLRYTAERGGYHTISESFLFTNQDLENIVNEAYERRNQAQANQAAPQPKRGLFGK